MKFVLISNNLTSVKNFRCDFLLEIAKKGYKIYILAPDLNFFSEEKKYLEAKGFNVIEIRLDRVSTNPISDLFTLIDIFRVLKKIKPNVVLSYTIKPIIYGSIAAFFLKIPKIFTLISGLGFAFQEDSINKKSNFLKIVINKLYKVALICSDKVFFQNPDDQILLKNLGILNTKTQFSIVNGSGVNTSFFKQVPLVKNSDGSYKINFLMVARLLNDKGIREYLEAAKIIKSSYPNVEFNLVGGIDENPASITQNELDSIVRANKIRYWGKLTDVRQAIAENNVFVLPSYREGLPRAVLEAMSMGRAIITTDAPGCKETVVENINGFKVKVKSVNDLVHAMTNFVVNPSYVERMGQASREIVLEKFDVRKVNEIMIKEMHL